MQPERAELLASISGLLHCSSVLREQLRRYERTMTTIEARLVDGGPAVAASEGTAIPEDRRMVTMAIADFEAARRRLRLALLAAGQQEGASISEVGRVLGISRQLASRLAAEAATGQGGAVIGGPG